MLKEYKHVGWVVCITFSFDSKYIITGGDDHAVRVWELETEQEINVLVGHKSSVNSIAISNDSKYIFSGSEESLIMWE